MKNSYLCSFIFSLLLIGCKNQDIDTELEKSIIEYQNKIPIPSSEKINKDDLKGYRFVYLVDVKMKENDTIVNIVRSPSGVPKSNNYFGVYEVNESTPVIIYDENNLGGAFIKNKVKNSLLKKYELNKKQHRLVDYPPVYSYKITKDKINLLRIDTISDNWIK